MPGLLDALPVLFAQNAPAGGAAGGGAAGGPTAGLVTFLPYVLILGFWFYFILIRPQQKQEKLRKQMIGALKKNDKVLTSAGIYGTVVSVDPEQDRVTLRIDEDKGVKATFSKGSIVRIFDGSTEKEKATETASK